MHILFLTPSFPPKVGGGERYAHALATALAQRGHHITVVTGDARQEADFWRPQRPGPVVDAQEGPLRVVRCPMAGLPGGFTGLTLWRKAMIVLSALPGQRTALLERMAARVPHIPALAGTLADLGAHDLVHAFNLSWEHPLIQARDYARNHNLPLVVTPFFHPGAGPHDRVILNNTMAHQRRAMAQADAVTTLTAIERDHLTGLDIAPERIHVVGSGSDALSAEVDSGIDVMERYGLSAPLVLFIGRVGRDKGALHAAEAVRALSGQGVHVTLGLIGQIAPEFERYYGRLPAAARQIIRPLGVVDEPIKHALLSRAHALVLPSRVESFGLVFLEAWAHGVPIIGARAGGIPGVIDDEVNGFLVEYGDVQGLAERLGALVTNRALAHAMGECGRQKRDREYSWDAVCHRTLAAYEAAMADRATDSSTGGL